MFEIKWEITVQWYSRENVKRMPLGVDMGYARRLNWNRRNNNG